MLEPIYEQYRARYYGDELVKKMEEARAAIVNQLIEDKLILSEAKRLGVEVTERDIDEKVAEVESRFEDKEKFRQVLFQQGMNMKALREKYKEQMMTRRLIDNKVGSKVSVSPVEIKNYYETHQDEFIQPEEVRLSNILIRPKKDEGAKAALVLAREILRRLKEGGDFAALAKEYSEGPGAADGGNMGYVKKGDLLPEIEEVVFKLKPGETSDIVQTAVGYHIFRVEEKKERAVKSLSEVRREVEETVFRAKVKDKLKGWVENLKKNAYIAYK
jgi:parvulin-like peptidyl-prolyl isomerase